MEEGGEPERAEAAGTDEGSEQLRAIFRRADRNSDGSLSRAELIIRLRKDAELAALLTLPQQIVDGAREAEVRDPHVELLGASASFPFGGRHQLTAPLFLLVARRLGRVRPSLPRCPRRHVRP